MIRATKEGVLIENCTFLIESSDETPWMSTDKDAKSTSMAFRHNVILGCNDVEFFQKLIINDSSSFKKRLKYAWEYLFFNKQRERKAKLAKRLKGFDY